MCILLFYMYFGISYFIFICLAGNVIINVIDIVLLLSTITETIPDFLHKLWFEEISATTTKN